MMAARLHSLTEQLVELPRLTRMIIVGFFALMVVFLLFPLVDHIYIRFFFTVETVMVPALVSMVFGSAFYIIGWRVYVGTVGTIPQAEKWVLWYFVIGVIVTILVVGLFVYGVFILNLPVNSV